MDWKNEGSEHFENHAANLLLPIYPWFLRDLEKTIGAGIKGLSVLEIGCGPGFMLPLFKKENARIICGLDVSSSMLDSARKSRRSSGCWLIQGNACQLPFAQGTFDIVFSRGSLFFWSDLNDALLSIKFSIKTGGTAMIGGGYGMSTPQNIIDSVVQHNKEKSKKMIPRLDLDFLLESARKIGGNAEIIQARHRGFWLIWKP